MNPGFRWDLPLPVLATERLVLRPFGPGDAAAVQAFAGARAIADTTLAIPHPYPEGAAAAWIASHADARARGLAVQYAIARGGDDAAAGEFLGTVSLGIDRHADMAEMGYWLGEPHWGEGYCTEAALRLLQFAFADLGLNRVHARYLCRNPASGRVLQKLGLRHEGTLRQHVRKWDVLEDIHVVGVLASEWRDVQAGRAR